MERHLYPKLHQELCEDEIRKMAKTGRANFVIYFTENKGATLIPKEPYQGLYFLSIKMNTNPSPLRQSADGHWVLETSNNSIDAIARQLPEVMKECYPNAVAGIKKYSLSTSQNKPPIITVEAA